MIRLNPIPYPVELTSSKIQELTELYKANTKKSVWKQTYITKGLLALSNNKCCYCECNVSEESNYMEVEHFFPKSLYPNKVVEWANLLPSCKRCNMAKSNWDVGKEPIINPVELTPSEHLYFKHYRLYSKTPLGKTTIDVVNLNDRGRLGQKRFDIGSKLIDALENLLESVRDYVEGRTTHTRRRNRILRTLRNLMIEATPQREYSAITATILLDDANYQQIKSLFIANDLWTSVFEDLEKEVQYCVLDLK